MTISYITKDTKLWDCKRQTLPEGRLYACRYILYPIENHYKENNKFNKKS